MGKKKFMFMREKNKNKKFKVAPIAQTEIGSELYCGLLKKCDGGR